MLVSLNSPVDPNTPSMTPMVYRSSKGAIPYQYIDKAKENPDRSMLFRCAVTMLKVFIDMRNGDDSDNMGERVTAGLDQANKLHVRILMYCVCLRVKRVLRGWV